MRPALEEDDKKISITISIDRQVLKNLKVKNKSALINWLLKEHLNNCGYKIKNEFLI